MDSPIQTAVEIKSASEIVEQVKRDFEVYKDKVDELEGICTAHEALSVKLNHENDALKLLFKKIKHYALEDDMDRLRDLLTGIEL